MLQGVNQGADGQSIDPMRRLSSMACCPIIAAIVACWLIFEFATAAAGGSTVGGIILIALACFCIYRCHQNKKNNKGCQPC